MGRTVFEHEWRVQVRSAEFLLFLISVTGFAWMLFPSALRACREEARWARRVEALTRDQARLALNWEELGRAGYWMGVEPRRCAPFRAVSPTGRRLIRLRTTAPPETLASPVRWLTSVADPISGLDLMVFWVGLLALLTGTSAVTGEKSAKTLAMVWAVWPRRTAWWAAKGFGRLVPLWVGWGLAVGSGLLLAAAVVPDAFSRLDGGATLADAGVGGLYLTVWLSVGMALSSWARRPDVAVVAGGTVWLVLGFVVPWLGRSALNALVPPMSAAEFFGRQYQAGSRYFQEAEVRKQRVFESWMRRAAAVPDLPERMRLQEEVRRRMVQIDQEAQERWARDVEGLERLYIGRFERYWGFVTWLGWISPVVALEKSFGGPVERWGLEVRRTLWERWRSWRTWIGQKALAQGGVQYVQPSEADPFAATRPNADEVPPLRMTAGASGGSLGGLSQLIFQSIIAVLLGWIGVRGYDPR